MKSPASPRARLAALLALAASTVSAHSWIESAFVVAPNGTFVGAEGFPRGYVPRTDPGFNDKVAQHQIPEGGVYKGDEVLNKYPLEAKPKHPMLQAAPGSKVAIRHLENGHVTLPQAQANKPLNRGTVFLYGTSEPKPQEKLADVHLVWNQDGTAGDKRGRLLATRNYDDGQCFQDNKQAMAQERVAKLAGAGAKVEKELKCQSAITIPRDAKPGSVYTVYWYWDWPTLKPEKVDMEGTRKGQFPWGGSFKRGDEVPNGWTADAIVVNESYSSVIDIEIVDRVPGIVAKEGAADWVDKQDIYTQGIKSQVVDSFDVPVDNLGGGGGGKPSPAPAGPPASGAPAPPAPTMPAAPAESKAAGPAPQSLPVSSMRMPVPLHTAGSSARMPVPLNTAGSSARMPVPSSGPGSSQGMSAPCNKGAAAAPVNAPRPSKAAPVNAAGPSKAAPVNAPRPSKVAPVNAPGPSKAAPVNAPGPSKAAPVIAPRPSKVVVTKTVTVPPTTVVQTVYVTDSPRLKAKRARAPATTLVTRTKQAPVPAGTPITPSRKRDDKAAEPEPFKLRQRN